jgi:hypothetical protein
VSFGCRRHLPYQPAFFTHGVARRRGVSRKPPKPSGNNASRAIWSCYLRRSCGPEKRDARIAPLRTVNEAVHGPLIQAKRACHEC